MYAAVAVAVLASVPSRAAVLGNPPDALPEGAPRSSILVQTSLYQATFDTLGALPTSWRLARYPELAPSRRKIRAYLPSAAPAEKSALEALLAHLEAQDASRTHLLEAQRMARAAGDEQQARNLEYELGLLLGYEVIPRDAGADRWFGAVAFNNGWFDSAVVYAATAEGTLRVEDRPLTLAFEADAGGATLIKRYTFYPESYRCDLEVIARAVPGSPLDGADRYTLYWGPGIGQQYGRLSTPANLATHIGQKIRQQPPASLYKSQRKGGDVLPGLLDWFALEDQYFAAIVIPHSRVERTVARVHPASPNDLRVLGGVPLALETTEAGRASQERFTLYLGPKDYDNLVALGEETTELLFSGWTGGLSLLMLRVLQFFHNLTGNYGIAIILLTLAVRLVLFPIAQKQFKHMKESQAKMERLKPLLDQLKEKYKDDQQRQQQEQMKLMQQHGIVQGQLKGCLPMFLQLPIFIALFYTLQRAIELRGATFVWWITDLSVEDAAFYIPFPVALPLVGYVLSFNVLPIINTAITWVQMKKSSPTAPADPTQKMMMNIMPVFMLVLLWPWPSGLFIYWTCSSLFGVVQQYWINKNYNPAEAAKEREPKERRRRVRREAAATGGHRRKDADEEKRSLADRLGLSRQMARLRKWVEEGMNEHGGRSPKSGRGQEGKNRGRAKKNR